MPLPPHLQLSGQTTGAFQFLSADVRKSNKPPFSLSIAAVLTSENLGNVKGCSKPEMHPVGKKFA
jgi:hypothetical protein